MKREFLVTKFVCASCGENLDLSCDVPRGAGSYARGQPNGAAMVEQLVAIKPCRCVTGPLDDVRRDARALIG